MILLIDNHVLNTAYMQFMNRCVQVMTSGQQKGFEVVRDN